MSGIGPGIGNVQTVRASSVLTNTFVVSSQIRVAGARFITLDIKVVYGSDSNEVVIVPLVAQNDLANTGIAYGVMPSPPAVGDDDWRQMFESNLAETDTVIDAGITMRTGADYTKAPVHRMVTLEPIVIRLKALPATPDCIRGSITLNVAGQKWFQLDAADADATGTKATCQILCTVHN